MPICAGHDFEGIWCARYNLHNELPLLGGVDVLDSYAKIFPGLSSSV